MGFLGSVSGLGYVLNFLSFPLALLFTLVAFLLGWIGFSVSDWLEFTTLLGYRAKFGLWNYCTLSLNFYSNGYSCTSWYKLSGMYIPNFLYTVQAMITLACLFMTFALVVAFAAAILRFNIFKLLPLLAGFLTFIAMVFVIVGIAVFGGEYESYMQSMGATNYYPRWGYWIFILIVILLFFATVLFPIRTFHKFLLYKRTVENRAIESRILNRSSSMILQP